jgi:hypothetical protein
MTGATLTLSSLLPFSASLLVVGGGDTIFGDGFE